MNKFFAKRALRCHFLPLVLSLVLALGMTSASAATLDGIAAVVGDDIVLYSELASRMREVEAQLSAQGTPLPPADILQRQVLDRIILRRLQIQRASNVGVEVSDLEINDAMAKIAQRNGVTVEQMQAAMEAEGLDYASYRKDMRDELTINQLRRREIEGRVSVSENDVKMFVEAQRATLQEEYHLRHILISIPSGSTPEQRDIGRTEAQRVYLEVSNGLDFGQAAATYSDGQQALNGGDLGWRTASTLPTMFASVVPTMQEGEIADIIETRSGFHIIRLEGRRRGATPLRRSEVKARHILIAPNDVRDNALAREQASEVYQELIGGADFAELAKQWSDDPGSAKEGGELGWQEPDAYVAEFQAQAERLRVGQISEPFRSPFGWHILQVQDRREKEGAPEGVMDAAREEIFQRKAAEEYELWLRRIRDEAYVEYRL